MIINVESQNDPDTPAQGLTAIECNGRELVLDGWHDRSMAWYAKVDLTPQQARALRRALRPRRRLGVGWLYFVEASRADLHLTRRQTLPPGWWLRIPLPWVYRDR